MALSSEPRSITISGNTINSSSIGGGYTYDSCAKLSGTGTLINNNFAGCADTSDASTKILEFVGDSASYIVKENTFTRGSTEVLAYIYDSCSTKKDHIIKNNIFDKATIDGSSEELSVNLTKSTFYSENKNQTSYCTVPITNNFFVTEYGLIETGFDSATGDIDVPSTNYQLTTFQPYSGLYSTFTSNILRIYDNAGVSDVGVERKLGWQDNISKYLPENVSLIECRIGIRSRNSNSLKSSSPNSTFKFSIARYVDSFDGSDYYAADLDSILTITPAAADMAENVLDSVDATTLNGTTSTVSITLDLTTLSNNVNGGVNEFAAVFDANFQREDPLITPVDIAVSPFIIKYRWQ